MAEWVLANKCPHCGGRMILSEYFSVSHNYLIRKDGQLSKRYRKSAEGPIDCVMAFCDTCKTYWDGDSTICDMDGVYIRGEGDCAYG